VNNSRKSCAKPKHYEGEKAFYRSDTKQPKLLDQVRNRIRCKHYSIRTEQAYIEWIRKFIFYHGKRHPAEMGENEISDFLTYLAVKRRVAASTQNQALSAIVFLYREVIQRDLGEFDNLKLHLEKVKLLHGRDLKEGFGAGGKGVKSPGDVLFP